MLRASAWLTSSLSMRDGERCVRPMTLSIVRCFRALIEGTEGTIVSVRAEEKIIMAIVDVDQWLHLKLDWSFRLVGVAFNNLLTDHT